MERESPCTMNLKAVGLAVKRSIEHTIDRKPSTLIAAMAESWPRVVSSLKAYIEAGSTLLTSL